LISRPGCANKNERDSIQNRDLMSFFMVIHGEESEDGHHARVRAAFPALIKD
jgi:hypothetical protein